MWTRLSVDESRCKVGFDCPSVWVDDEHPDELVVVGDLVPDGTVPTGDGEMAVRIRRQVVADAGIS